MNRTLYFRRRLAGRVIAAFSVAAAGVGLVFLALVLYTLIARGLPGMTLQTFTDMTPPPGANGGLLNAIVGSLILTFFATAIGAPIGILAGTYLAEYGRYARVASLIRFINDILLSAPSIIVGLFVYEILVVPMGHFSGIAGIAALGILVVPIVVRTTEDMLSLVRNDLREAATALGAPRWMVIRKVAYRAAISGLVTGVLLAIARISGETAPLLFSALNNQFWSTNVNAPIANLPVTIFQFAMSPYADWQRLAWSGALLITFTVLLLNAVGRVVASRQGRTR
jgi:phosphate transport system permease protein